MVGVTELLIPAALVIMFVLVLEVAPGLIRAFLDIIGDVL